MPAQSMGNNARNATITGAVEGVVHTRMIRITAMVGKLLTTEIKGDKKRPKAGSRYATTEQTSAAANERKNAESVREKVPPNARQNPGAERIRPVSLSDAPSEGMR